MIQGGSEGNEKLFRIDGRIVEEGSNVFMRLHFVCVVVVVDVAVVDIVMLLRVFCGWLDFFLTRVSIFAAFSNWICVNKGGKATASLDFEYLREVA